MDSRAAFPSLHAAVSLVALVYAWRYAAPWFWVLLPFVLGLWVSTIYLRHHYVVDLLAGWALAPVAVWLAPRLDALVGRPPGRPRLRARPRRRRPRSRRRPQRLSLRYSPCHERRPRAHRDRLHRIRVRAATSASERSRSRQLDGGSPASASPPGDGNSVAAIVWHVAGNLRSRFTDFLTTDGEKPWRDRESEFAQRAVSVADVRAKWEDGWNVLFQTLSTPLGRGPGADGRHPRPERCPCWTALAPLGRRTRAITSGRSSSSRDPCAASAGSG